MEISPNRRDLLKAAAITPLGKSLQDFERAQEVKRDKSVMSPGMGFVRKNHYDTEHLIILLSSDREAGIDCVDALWRCAEFMICENREASTDLLGAQIVLYTEAELEAFRVSKDLREISWLEGDAHITVYTPARLIRWAYKNTEGD